MYPLPDSKILIPGQLIDFTVLAAPAANTTALLKIAIVT